MRAGECSSAGQLDSRLTLLAVKSAALTKQKVLRVDDLKMKNKVGKTKIYMMDAGKRHGEQYKNINKQESLFFVAAVVVGVFRLFVLHVLQND